jgi:hypothetical protein
MLKDDGVLYVPVLDKQFNRLGEEINKNINKSGGEVGTHILQPLSYYDYKNQEEV